MKDKEKQICKHFDEEVCSKLDCKKNCKYYGKANCKTCIHEDICQLRTYGYSEEEVKEKGCEHYQPKLPEDSVVLSKEEHNALLLEQKRLREIVDRIPCGYELKEITRKETAEKIYRMADEICTGSQNDGDKILAMIKDNFGVEIKD